MPVGLRVPQASCSGTLPISMGDGLHTTDGFPRHLSTQGRSMAMLEYEPSASSHGIRTTASWHMGSPNRDAWSTTVSFTIRLLHVISIVPLHHVDVRYIIGDTDATGYSYRIDKHNRPNPQIPEIHSIVPMSMSKLFISVPP